MSSAFPTDRPSHPGRAWRAIFTLAAVAGALSCVPVVAAAQAQKTIRVAFPIAESGFDPQAIADNYSATIARASVTSRSRSRM